MKKQYGFTVIELFIILVVVSLVGSTGWYVWSSTRRSDKIIASTSQTAKQLDKEPGVAEHPKDQVTKTELMTSNYKTVSVGILADWDVQERNGIEGLLFLTLGRGGKTNCKASDANFMETSLAWSTKMAVSAGSSPNPIQDYSLGSAKDYITRRHSS